MAPKQSIDTQQPTKSGDHIRLEVRVMASWEKRGFSKGTTERPLSYYIQKILTDGQINHIAIFDDDDAAAAGTFTRRMPLLRVGKVRPGKG
jgi:hypothetical protein